MAYVGGKSTGFRHIIDVLNNPKYDNMDYLELFCGYCHITKRIKNKKSITINDKNELLICLLNGIRDNLPYPKISRERYNELKNQHNIITFERAIAGFCYSYNGKLWGGYVLDNSNSPSYKKYGKLMVYHNQRQNYYDKLKKNNSFMTASIHCNSYEDFKPTNCLIYCDPPYRNTTGYNKNNVGDFDHDKFWNYIREISKNNIVFVSEYNAPIDFEVVSQLNKKSTLSGKRLEKTEKLFTLILN